MLDLFKLAAILVAIIVLLRLRWNLGLVLFLASGLTGLLFGRSPVDMAGDAVAACLDPLTLRMVAVVLLITFMGELLRHTLKLEGLVRSLCDLFVDARWLLALMPMLIGTLPMVGGALFSAPMVDEASRQLDVNREQRTFVNYWFRHAMEPIFPLYPSLILAAGLMGVTVQELVRSQWPLFVAALAGGVLFGLLGTRQPMAVAGTRPPRRDTLQLLVKSAWPLLLVLGLSIVLKVDLIVSLLVTIVLLVITGRLAPGRVWAIARQTPLSIATIILGAMVFRGVLEASGAVQAVSAALGTLGIPVALLVFAVPVLPSLLTGLLVAAFAVGFPIVFPLIGPDVVNSGYGLLAYTGGLVGLMLSPVHLCLSLTRVYFKAEWGGIYRRVVPATALLILTAGIVLLIRQ